MLLQCPARVIVYRRPNNLRRLVFNKESLTYTSIQVYKEVDFFLSQHTLNKMKILEVGLSREKGVSETMMQGGKVWDLTVSPCNLVLSKIEPEYLFTVFDKWKEFGANTIGAPACRSQSLMVQTDDPSAYQPPLRSSLSRNLSLLFLLTDGRTARPGLKLRASGD